MAIHHLIYLIVLAVMFIICVVEPRKRRTDQKAGEALSLALVIIVGAAVWTIFRAL